MNKYSVLMSVYLKEHPEHFQAAIDSMLNQTVPPSDFVIVCDGDLTPELDYIIIRYVSLYPGLFNVLRLPVNMGLGNALRIGVEACKYDFIARMDTDDISVADRIERQLEVFAAHPEVSVCGGQIAEFTDSPDSVVGYRIVPSSHQEIYSMAKKRNPMNHMTVLFRKSDVLDCGNYCHFLFFEDYHLWTKMLCNGKIFHNIPEVCVKARVDSMFSRRTGVAYYKRSKQMMKHLLSLKMIGYPRYFMNNLIRFVATVIIPGKALGFIMPFFTRKKNIKLTELHRSFP